MVKNYPEHYKHLRELMAELGKFIPDTMAAFSQLHKAGAGDGVLSAKTKELIALATAICDGCIAFHIHDAVGASPIEIAETIGVAVLMGGGPAVMYGCEALEALKQFEAQEK